MLIQHGLMPGQVLQRLKSGANATVTGECATDGDVLATISAGSKPLKGWAARKVGRASNAKFSAKLLGIPAGGPYTIKLAVGKETATVTKVSVGDVWLLAGQSNMQGCGNLDRAPKPHPKVHAQYMDGHWDVAVEPIHFLMESPDLVHNANPITDPHPGSVYARERKKATKGVGPGIFFGAELFKRSGVPQGLICTAHGGTSMQQWSPDKKGEGGKSLYGSMLKSWKLTGQPVAGVLWYQGESDANDKDAPVYVERMQKLVAAIREDLSQPTLPFFLVQIGKYFTASPDCRGWNAIQDHQANLHKHIKRCACVSAADLSLDDGIHISSAGYSRLGVRLARLADYFVYGNKKENPAPEVASLSKSVKDGVVRIAVKFKHVVGGLKSDGYPTGFALIDPDGRNTNAVFKVELENDTALLYADLTNGVNSKLVYGYGFSPVVNITDARDMPIPVLGPRSLGGAPPMTGFVVDWQVSTILPEGTTLDQWKAPAPSAEQQLSVKKFPGYFCDMHLDWGGKPGQAVFFNSMELAEDMDLKMRFGYDGPIRVWIDEEEVYIDMKGTNPALPDAKIVPLKVKAGIHSLAIAMDLNQGRAWGFFLRFERLGVSKEQAEKAKVALPKFSVP